MEERHASLVESNLITPPVDSQRLIFQRNDPRRIQSRHAGLDGYLHASDTARSPDIIGLALDTALRTRAIDISDAESCHQAWTSYASQHATAKPGEEYLAPSFSSVRMCLEFKKKLEMNDLPKVPLQWNRESPLKEVEPHAIPGQGSVKDRSRSMHPSPSASALLETSEASCGRSGSLGPSKRDQKEDRYNDLPPVKKWKDADGKAYPVHNVSEESVKWRKLPASIQAAIYAGERLSSSFAIHHALNAVVVGPCSHVFTSLHVAHIGNFP